MFYVVIACDRKNIKMDGPIVSECQMYTK